MIIAVDFDGTCVTHEYPNVGKDVGAVAVLKALVQNGHKLILWTMRSGRYLMDAKAWFDENRIELWGINCNPEQKSWTDSPKAYAQLYIDDAAFGAWLLSSTISKRPYFDWTKAFNSFKQSGIIK